MAGCFPLAKRGESWGYGTTVRRRVVTKANPKSKSEKFPPPHQDAAVGYPSHNGGPASFGPTDDNSFGSSKSSRSVKEPGSLGGSSRPKTTKKDRSRAAPSRNFIRTFLPTSISLSMDFGFRSKDSGSEVFGRR
ncbi:hypothetical protein L1887_26078 [Cichorium endivia]|nr:hypothetical protein L1887_26078 [Cichorium endivia]